MRRPALATLILLTAVSAIGCRPRPVPPNVTPPQAEASTAPTPAPQPDTPAKP